MGPEWSKGWASLVYGFLMSGMSPMLLLHVQWRRMRGREHVLRWSERLGYASLPRPSGALLWFHAVSVGEGMAAIPIIRHCIQVRPSVNILMTTSTVTANSVLERFLPPGVLCQFAPVDTPVAVERFLRYWHPQAGIFMESELWPNLILASARQGMPLALLNARMSAKSFERWSLTPVRSLVATMLSQFLLIAPLSTKEAVRFQILGAPPFVIHFPGNLKYACEGENLYTSSGQVLLELQKGLSGRKIWLAASTHMEEEDAIVSLHKQLKSRTPSLLTIIAPRHPERGHQIRTRLQEEGLDVSQRSQGEPILKGTDVYVADTIGELKELYALVPIAFVGGSLVEGLKGHNIAEAAAAGCAVLTGHHIGHFAEMVSEMQKLAPLSVQQVDGEQLLDVLHELLSDEVSLCMRREAARYAFTAAANGVVVRVWEVLDRHILTQAFGMAAVNSVKGGRASLG